MTVAFARPRTRDEPAVEETLSVCMTIQSFRPIVGGAQIQLERLLPYLAARGIRVTVLTRAYRGCPKVEHANDAEVRRVGVAGESPRASAAFVAASVAHLLSRRRKIDVVHAHGALSEGVVALAASLLGLPAAVKVLRTGYRGDFDRLATKPLGRMRARALVRRVWFITTTSEGLEELTRIGVPAERIFEIPNGVDLDEYRPARVGEREQLRSELDLPAGPVALYVGRLSDVKNVDTLIEALAAVPQLSLVVLGDGFQRRALEQLAAKTGVTERVRFMGFTDRVAEYLRASDAFVLPSRAEGMSNALLEAMASGLACAATPVSGVAELLGDGRGLVVEAGDVGAWGEAMRRLGLDEEFRERTGTLAASFVRSRFSLEATAEKLAAAYAAILSEPRGRRSRQSRVAPA